jgi:hypothetical protein
MNAPANNNIEPKRELKDGAEELFANPAFNAAILKMRQDWHAQLMMAKTDLDERRLVAQMRCLEMLPLELTALINDFKIAAKRQGHG